MLYCEGKYEMRKDEGETRCRYCFTLIKDAYPNIIRFITTY